MLYIDKKTAFPPSLHLIGLEGGTTPSDFLSDFGYERPLQQCPDSNFTIDPSDFVGDCYPLLISKTIEQERKERILAALKRLALEKKYPVFVFSYRAGADFDRFITSLPSVYTWLTYDKEDHGGSILKSHEYPMGPYSLSRKTNAVDSVSPQAPADTQATKDNPARSVVKVSDLTKNARGFHIVKCTAKTINALLRGHATNIICSSELNIQRDDYIVLTLNALNPLEAMDTVWEVSYVTYIHHSELPSGYGQVSISLKKRPNARFVPSPNSSTEDAIEFSIPTQPPTTP